MSSARALSASLSVTVAAGRVGIFDTTVNIKAKVTTITVNYGTPHCAWRDTH